jgi:hypothetical protein
METGELNTLDLGSAEPTPETGAAEPANETELEVEDVGSQNPDEESAASENQGQDDPWKDYVEVEIDGEKVRVPEKFKDGYLRQQDYTRKTQEAAVLRKTLEGQKAEIERMQAVSSEELQARSAKMGIEAQLKQYENVDWAAEYEKDPFPTQQHFMRYQQLEKANAQIDAHLSQAEKARAEFAERDFATRAQETAKYAYEKLPGMSKELDDKITNFAVTDLGIELDTIKRLYSPQLYRTLYLAHVGQQVITKQSAPPKPAPIPPKPLTTVTAKGGSVRKTPATMSVAEMDAYLNKRS